MTGWRAVLDAQVWVSAAIRRGGPARRIVDRAVRGDCTLVTSRYIREEVLEVFARPSVRRWLSPALDPAEWLDVVELVAADVVEEVSGPAVIPADPDDDPYLWTAFAGAATHVVTWDAEVLAVKHFHLAQVVDPPSFLRLLESA